MAGRITKDELRYFVDYLYRQTGLPLSVQWAYGNPRVFIQEGDGWREFSPRLPISQLYVWLEAFWEGYQRGRAR